MVYDHNAAPVHGPTSGSVDPLGFDYFSLPKLLIQRVDNNMQLQPLAGSADQ